MGVWGEVGGFLLLLMVDLYGLKGDVWGMLMVLMIDDDVFDWCIVEGDESDGVEDCCFWMFFVWVCFVWVMRVCVESVVVVGLFEE